MPPFLHVYPKTGEKLPKVAEVSLFLQISVIPGTLKVKIEEEPFRHNGWNLGSCPILGTGDFKLSRVNQFE